MVLHFDCLLLLLLAVSSTADVPTEYVLDVLPNCGSNGVDDAYIIVRTDIATDVDVECYNGLFAMNRTDDAHFYIPVSYPPASSNCIFNKRQDDDVYVVKLVPTYGEPTNPISQEFVEYTVTCTFSPRGDNFTVEHNVVQGLIAPDELQTHGGPDSGVQMTLELTDVLGRDISNQTVPMGKSVQLKLEATNTGGTSAVGLKPVACDGIGIASGKRYAILRAGCGDGLVFDQSKGFTTTGLISRSPYFEAFGIARDEQLKFECNVTLCNTTCDGITCVNQRKRSLADDDVDDVTVGISSEWYKSPVDYRLLQNAQNDETRPEDWNLSSSMVKLPETNRDDSMQAKRNLLNDSGEKPNEYGTFQSPILDSPSEMVDFGSFESNDITDTVNSDDTHFEDLVIKNSSLMDSTVDINNPIDESSDNIPSNTMHNVNEVDSETLNNHLNPLTMDTDKPSSESNDDINPENDVQIDKDEIGQFEMVMSETSDQVAQGEIGQFEMSMPEGSDLVESNPLGNENMIPNNSSSLDEVGNIYSVKSSILDYTGNNKLSDVGQASDKVMDTETNLDALPDHDSVTNVQEPDDVDLDPSSVEGNPMNSDDVIDNSSLDGEQGEGNVYKLLDTINMNTEGNAAYSSNSGSVSDGTSEDGDVKEFSDPSSSSVLLSNDVIASHISNPVTAGNAEKDELNPVDDEDEFSFEEDPVTSVQEPNENARRQQRRRHRPRAERGRHQQRSNSNRRTIHSHHTQYRSKRATIDDENNRDAHFFVQQTELPFNDNDPETYEEDSLEEDSETRDMLNEDNNESLMAPIGIMNDEQEREVVPDADSIDGRNFVNAPIIGSTDLESVQGPNIDHLDHQSIDTKIFQRPSDGVILDPHQLGSIPGFDDKGQNIPGEFPADLNLVGIELPESNTDSAPSGLRISRDIGSHNSLNVRSDGKTHVTADNFEAGAKSGSSNFNKGNEFPNPSFSFNSKGVPDTSDKNYGKIRELPSPSLDVHNDVDGVENAVVSEIQEEAPPELEKKETVNSSVDDSEIHTYTSTYSNSETLTAKGSVDHEQAIIVSAKVPPETNADSLSNTFYSEPVQSDSVVDIGVLPPPDSTKEGDEQLHAPNNDENNTITTKTLSSRTSSSDLSNERENNPEDERNTWTLQRNMVEGQEMNTLDRDEPASFVTDPKDQSTDKRKEESELREHSDIDTPGDVDTQEDHTNQQNPEPLESKDESKLEGDNVEMNLNIGNSEDEDDVSPDMEHRDLETPNDLPNESMQDSNDDENEVYDLDDGTSLGSFGDMVKTLEDDELAEYLLGIDDDHTDVSELENENARNDYDTDNMVLDSDILASEADIEDYLNDEDKDQNSLTDVNIADIDDDSLNIDVDSLKIDVVQGSDDKNMENKLSETDDDDRDDSEEPSYASDINASDDEIEQLIETLISNEEKDDPEELNLNPAELAGSTIFIIGVVLLSLFTVASVAFWVFICKRPWRSRGRFVVHSP